MSKKNKTREFKFENFGKLINLYKLNYSLMLTCIYDDCEGTEEDFKKKLRKYLSNLHTRNGWKYFGFWENGESVRLCFHCFFLIPKKEIVA